MPDKINTEQRRDQLREIVENIPLESDAPYQAPPVGSSASGDAATKHDQVLYRFR